MQLLKTSMDVLRNEKADLPASREICQSENPEAYTSMDVLKRHFLFSKTSMDV
jgi:hypothetical protein